MQQIEKYFMNNDDVKINDDFFKQHENFNVKNKELFKLMVNANLWANDIYYLSETKERLEQLKFRENILKRDKKCIITDIIPIECQACHIIPISEGGCYDIENGLLINSNHHITFDKYLWSINPDTFLIDVVSTDSNIVGSIALYKGKKVNIQPNNIMKMYLSKRWNIYLKNKLQS
jgi:hypothetical protein